MHARIHGHIQVTCALLWTLSWISTPERRVMLRGIALDHLTAVSSLSASVGSSNKTGVRPRLSAAFDEAIALNDDGVQTYV